MAAGELDQAELKSALRSAYARQSLADHPSATAGLTLVQYWNDTPDDQVARLIEHTRAQGARYGFEHRLFSEAEARRFLAETFGADAANAFDSALHQAQKSDLFRYHFLLAEGGLWVDADITLTGDPRRICTQGRACVSYKNRSTGRLANRIMWSPPGSAFMQHIVDQATSNMNDPALYEKCREERDILTLSGPRVVNRAFLELAKGAPPDGGGAQSPLLFDEQIFDALFVSGEAFLAEPLQYKTTARSWQAWAAEIPGTPISNYIRRRK